MVPEVPVPPLASVAVMVQVPAATPVTLTVATPLPLVVPVAVTVQAAKLLETNVTTSPTTGVAGALPLVTVAVTGAVAGWTIVVGPATTIVFTGLLAPAVGWTALPTAWQFVVDPVEQTVLPSLP